MDKNAAIRIAVAISYQKHDIWEEAAMPLKKYERAEIKIIEFEVEDAITTSGTEEVIIPTLSPDGGFGWEEEEGL